MLRHKIDSANFASAFWHMCSDAIVFLFLLFKSKRACVSHSFHRRRLAISEIKANHSWLATIFLWCLLPPKVPWEYLWPMITIQLTKPLQSSKQALDWSELTSNDLQWPPMTYFWLFLTNYFWLTNRPTDWLTDTPTDCLTTWHIDIDRLQIDLSQPPMNLDELWRIRMNLNDHPDHLTE